MIASFGVAQGDVAKWAGITSSVFSLSQAITAVPWGKASDRFGRKPVIMMGLFSTMTLFVMWGISTSLPMAIVIRAIQGGCNGNVGIIRTMVAEMVPQKELQPRAFSIMPLVWSIGSIFGPAFGGVFANPAEQFPGVFGNSHFLKKYPYALPNLLSAVMFLISLATGILFLKETLQSKRYDRDWGLVLGERISEAFGDRSRRRRMQQFRRFSFQDSEASAPLLHARAPRGKLEKPIPPSMSSVFSRQTTINLISYTFLALHSVAYDQLLPVFLNFPKEPHRPKDISLPVYFSGGFGLTSNSIGTIFTLYGLVCGIVQFLLFPVLCKRFGVLQCFRFSTITLPVVYILTPFTVLFEDVTRRYVALSVVMLFKAFAVIVGFPCTTILLTNSAASLSILGTLNGFATTFSAVGRAAGPAIAGTAFSWGVKRGIIGAPYWTLALIGLVGIVPSYMIVEGPGPSAGGSAETSVDNSAETSEWDTDYDENAMYDDSDEEDEDDDDYTDGEEEEAARAKAVEQWRASQTTIVPEAPDDGGHHHHHSEQEPLVGSPKSQHGPDYGTLRKKTSNLSR
ncbi:major facilitator superfamily protein [Xylariaceae sp. FL0804]|nr:major facilitator superfamily protein [Xylariaceae sp. FL0804]